MKRFLSIGLLLIVGLSFIFSQIPAGYYYHAHGKKRDALKTALHELAQPRRVLRYGSGAGATWEGFFYADQRPDGSVYDMYSTIERFFNGFSGVSGMHIEHSLPKSWWGGANNFAYRDLYHLFPSDGITNSTKNNFPLGVVGENPRLDNGLSKVGNNIFGGVYTGMSFEPADEYKGDFARAYLYISTVYQDLAPLWSSPMMQNNTYPVWTPWAIDLLMQWHRDDPVSVKEILRQEVVFGIQRNRNPFVDYPDLVDYIWGKDTLNIFPFPEETEAFLVSPRTDEAIVFDVILENSSVQRNFTIRGVNMHTNATVTLRNSSPHFNFPVLTVTPQELIQGRNVTVTFTPQSSGIFRDTLVISGGNLQQEFIIPLQGQATPQFMTLFADEITPVGARLNWMLDPQAQGYRVKVQEGSATAGDLIISTYVEWTGFDKAIEIYNGTGRTVNLENYSLQRQSNGAGPFVSNYRFTGTLEHGNTHLIVHRTSSNQELKNIANALTDSVLNFNGNDALILLHHGLVIDMVGIADAGDLVFWGEDKTLKRKSNVTHPRPVFDMGEWEELPMNQLALLRSHQMEFGSPVIIREIDVNENYRSIQGLIPETDYVYHATSLRQAGQQPSVNSIQFRTAPLEAPVAMEALNVRETSFVANWEQDPYVNSFLLDVYYMTGTADTTIFEGFDMVGSNGKPLPTGWTGTASGNYITAASSGTTAPSLRLGNTGEFVQTAQYPQPVTFFEFMYRFPSNAAGSYFFVNALKGNEWVRIDSIGYFNLSKYYVNYRFAIDEDVRALRITYQLKVAGNIALDDFTITYGSHVPVFVWQDVPVTGNEKLVDNLQPEMTYHYRVKSTLSGKFSPWSESVAVQTQQASSVRNPQHNIRVFPAPGGINVEGLQGGEQLRVYNLSGMLVTQQLAGNSNVIIPLQHSGLYIVAVYHPAFKLVRKIIL